MIYGNTIIPTNGLRKDVSNGVAGFHFVVDCPIPLDSLVYA